MKAVLQENSTHIHANVQWKEYVHGLFTKEVEN